MVSDLTINKPTGEGDYIIFFKRYIKYIVYGIRNNGTIIYIYFLL